MISFIWFIFFLEALALSFALYRLATKSYPIIKHESQGTEVFCIVIYASMMIWAWAALHAV